MLKAYCTSCGKTRTEFTGSPRCQCGGILSPKIDFKYRDGTFSDHFPYLHTIISLGEVQTPIIQKSGLMFKLEYFSPTFSYKDRGSRVLISSLLDHLNPGSEINEDSSGNAGSSISAYGSAAGFHVNIFVPETTVPAKISQIRAYGANISTVRGSREDVSRAASGHAGYYASHVLNPEFRDGMREIAYEIFTQLNGEIPDCIFVPVSAGTLLLGMISGFEHLADSGEISRIPKFVAVQTEAVSPLCGVINGFQYDPTRVTESVADALVSRQPPLLGMMAEKLNESGGRCVTVNENEIISAREILARSGILVEYSSATVYAAYQKSHMESRSLLIMTGNGLKTP